MNRKLNVALVTTAGRHGKKFNAKELIDKYGNATIIKPLVSKKVRISQVHLSCKAEYEAATSGSKSMSRMKKELFSNMFRTEFKSQRNPEEFIIDAETKASGDDDHFQPYYACESKIQLNVDDLFG